MRAMALRLSLVALCAAPVAAMRPEGEAAMAAPAPFDIEMERDRCGQLSQCYCIKGTPCGWCKSSNRSMLGTKKGPMGGETCSVWIPSAGDCPNLHCQGTHHEELVWKLHCGWLPVLTAATWVMVTFWRTCLRAQNSPSAEDMAVLDSVDFSSGTAVSRAPASTRGPEWAEAEAADFFGLRRSFEAFRKGMHCPPEERLPGKPSRPYELNLSDMSVKPGEAYEKARVGPHRLSVTIRVALQWRTALGATLVSSIGLMLLTALYISCMRNAARYLDKSDYMWLASATKEVSSIATPLQTAVGMLLSFYALNRLGWYWNVLLDGHALQGRFHDLAMIGGAIRKDTDDDWKARYTLYRHEMLDFFFTYQPYTPRLRFLGFDPLIKCGLLEPDEAEILKQANRSPVTVTESWLANWVEENLEAEPRQQAYEALREKRAFTTEIQGLVEARAPVSFESLLFLVVYALVALLPFSPSNVEYLNREVVMQGAHVATVLGVGILSSFYLALIHMLRHLQAPFDHIGAPHDALNPCALMNSTERKLRDYLTLPFITDDDPHLQVPK